MKGSLAILVIVNLCISHHLNAQKSEVYDELEDSFSYGRAAKEKAIATIEYIKKCYQQSALDDVQTFARKARYEIEDAKSQSNNAASVASDAEDEASSIQCDGAEDEADEAETNFINATSNFDDVYTYLRRVELADNKDDIDTNLKRARNSIEEGINYLATAMIDLNDAIDELNRCTDQF